jgi:hypothetical protein
MDKKTNLKVVQGGKMSLREKILNIEDIQEQIVDVPKWGVKILVRELNGKQRDKIMQNAVDAKGNINFEKMHSEAIIAACYDPETKEKLFEESDRDQLMEKSSIALDTLYNVIAEMSGLSKKSEETIEKN